MNPQPDISTQICEKAKLSGTILAGVTDMASLRNSPSHKIKGMIGFPEQAKSFLVIALAHPESKPELDWWDGKGGTLGNRRLINISKDELENEELTEDDYEFIRNFGENLDSIVTGVNDMGKETTIIADVHTDTNTNKVLEEGVGYVDLIIVAYKVPDGRIIAGAGPVFSYYEFKHPIDDRLTDEQWKDMLQNGEEPDSPDWINSFVS